MFGLSYVFKIAGGEIHEIEAMGFMAAYCSKTGWERGTARRAARAARVASQSPVQYSLAADNNSNNVGALASATA